MFIIEYLKIIFIGLFYLSAVIGTAVLFLAFFGSMEMVYKARILDSPPTPWWTKVLNRLAWGINGLQALYHILINREQLYRTVLLVEAKERLPRPSSDFELLSYRPTTTGYAPLPGTILVFHANDEEEGEPLYVLRPFEFLSEDWKESIGRGI